MKPRYVYSQMRFIGVFLWLTGALWMFKNSDYSCDYVFYWWHPMTWLTYAILVIPCGIVGESVKDQVPVKLSDFWKRNIQQMRWVYPWTDLNKVPNFDHSKSVH